MTYELWVDGTPRPQGSKRGLPIHTGKFNPRSGKEIVNVAMVESSKDLKYWRYAVEQEARKLSPVMIVSAPVWLTILFCMPRPKSRAEEKWHITKPDGSKLLRAVEDALTGIAFKDDCYIARHSVEKQYCDVSPGALIQWGLLTD